jgi:hypothetical protein
VAELDVSGAGRAENPVVRERHDRDDALALADGLEVLRRCPRQDPPPAEWCREQALERAGNTVELVALDGEDH